MQLLANIDVDDLERAVDFYVGALGLRPGRRFGEHAAELVGTSSAIYLLVKQAGSRPAPGVSGRRRYRRHWTPVHLDFVVEDLDAATARATGCGATLEGPVATHRWGRIAQLADPFGHGFCLLEFHGRGYDEIATP